MAECSVCGDDSSLSYTCRRCERQFCSEHQLPENHNCVGLYLMGAGRWFAEKFEKNPQPESILGNQQSTPESGQRRIRKRAKQKRTTAQQGHFGSKKSSGSPSPDVNPDGSIQKSKNPDFDDKEDGPSILGRLRSTITQLTWRRESLSHTEQERREWKRKRKWADRKRKVKNFTFAFPLFVFKAAAGSVVLLFLLDYLF